MGRGGNTARTLQWCHLPARGSSPNSPRFSSSGVSQQAHVAADRRYENDAEDGQADQDHDLLLREATTHNNALTTH